MTDDREQALHQILRDLLLLNSAADRHVLAQHDLRQTRYYVLHHLYHDPGLTLAQLSDRVLIYSASASRIVYSMEGEGLVQRQDDPKDRRSFTLSLTANGRAFYEKVSADLTADIQRRFGALPVEVLTVLLQHGQTLRDVLESHQQGQIEGAS